jgi:hypothetical protein
MTRNGSTATATDRVVQHVQWHAPVGCSACHVYSMLELQASPAQNDDGWKQRSCRKAMGAPFSVEMTRVFIKLLFLSLDWYLMS